MGDIGGNDAKYRLSDGRDSREALERLEELLGGGKGLNPFGAAARYGRKLLRLPEDDKEVLLRTANERWRVESHPGQVPSSLEAWHAALRDEVSYGTSLLASFQIVANLPARIARWVIGSPPDVRDADRIAEQFMQVIEARSQQDGGADMEAHIAHAREATLSGVPTHYRRKVLERILDREEEALRGGSATPELEDLERDRDARRQHGWRALTGKRSSHSGTGRE